MAMGFRLNSDEDESHIIGTGTINHLSDAPATDQHPSALGMNASAIALKACRLVGGERETQHGDKRTTMRNIATIWNAWLAIRREPAAPLDEADVAQMLSLLKKARTQNGGLNADDSIDDVAYASIAGELALNPE